MSFKSLENIALGITQGYIGEDIVLKQGGTEKTIKGIFDSQWVESNNVSTYQQTVRVKESDLITSVSKSDTVKRGLKTYRVQVSQQDGPGALVLVLAE